MANARLRDLIFRRGLKQQEVADLAGINRTILSAIITGRVNPRPAERAAIALALAVDEADIFDSEEVTR
jgi:transcriptional regulator with XRE-family HTH domain